jgi:hypothetical protein
MKISRLRQGQPTAEEAALLGSIFRFDRTAMYFDNFFNQR